MANRGIKKVFLTPLDAVEDSDKEGLGVLRFEGNDVYKWVRYKEGTGDLNVDKGDVVSYLDYEDHEVTADHSDGNDIGAGVMQASVDEDGKYCWIRIRGIQTLNTDATAGSAGNAMTVAGADDKTVDVSAANTDHVCGILQDATAGANKLICDFPF